jgi:hypothetical protein
LKFLKSTPLHANTAVADLAAIYKSNEEERKSIDEFLGKKHDSIDTAD